MKNSDLQKINQDLKEKLLFCQNVFLFDILIEKQQEMLSYNPELVAHKCNILPNVDPLKK